MRYVRQLVIVGSFLAPFAADAQTGVQAVRVIPGYVCMSLNLTEQQMMNPSMRVPIKSAPSSSAMTTGYASSIVIARSPMHEDQGFVEVLQLDGREGWIAARDVRPWKNPGPSNQRCFPAVMSNGRVG